MAGRGAVSQDARLLLGIQGEGRTDLRRKMMSSVLDTTFEEPVNVQMFNQQLQINLENQEALGSARTRCNTVDEEINREILREGQTLQEV